MPYQVTPTAIPDVLILEPKVFGDHRGFFYESYSQQDFHNATGLTVSFVQGNHSRSAKGVLRGNWLCPIAVRQRPTDLKRCI